MAKKTKKTSKEITIELDHLTENLEVKNASIRMTGYQMEKFLKARLLAKEYRRLDKQFGDILNATINDDVELIERFQSLLRQIALSCLESIEQTLPISNP